MGFFLQAYDAKWSPSKNVKASSEFDFSLLNFELCLTLNVCINLKQILSNEAAKHEVLSALKHQKVMAKHCGKLNLIVSYDSLGDQANFVKTESVMLDKNIIMSSFKSSRDIQKKEGGPDSCFG